jgi:hypothetical protein
LWSCPLFPAEFHSVQVSQYFRAVGYFQMGANYNSKNQQYLTTN